MPAAPADAPPATPAATPAAPSLAPAPSDEPPPPAAPAAAASEADDADGPEIELTPEMLREALGGEGEPAGDAAPGEEQGADDEPESVSGGTTVGGYAELHYNLDNIAAPGDPKADIDMHRLVLFLAHRFDERLRFFAELEVEHAVTSAEDPGEVGVEQAFVEYMLVERALGLRAGMVLVPMGIINQWHEPPRFHGVERPTVDQVIIPSTWREGGLGVFGEPTEGLRYELFVVGGLNAAKFRASDGIRKGRQGVAEARADGLAVTGRIEVEPTLGVVGGVSGYLGEAGPNAELFDVLGAPVDINVPVFGVSADVRARLDGLEARAVIARFDIGDTDDLRFTFDADGNPTDIDVGAMLWGGYVELAYDVLRALRTGHQLLPFVRVERYDTLANVEGRGDLPEDEAHAVTEWALGLTHRPIPQVAFKVDYVLKDPDFEDASSVGRLDLGVGVMF